MLLRRKMYEVGLQGVYKEVLALAVALLINTFFVDTSTNGTQDFKDECV